MPFRAEMISSGWNWHLNKMQQLHAGAHAKSAAQVTLKRRYPGNIRITG